ncbi:Abi family protein [Rothia sp. P4278]|uniref:Abi family protein n=1 Tax=Rothia sp. P4278 TaxID=3402658 RepID=UPI003AE399FE
MMATIASAKEPLSKTILDIYQADAAIRYRLSRQLTAVELMLRTKVAKVIAEEYSPYGNYLEDSFYLATCDRVVESCLRDISRSLEPYILRYKEEQSSTGEMYSTLPIWSAVQAFSFGTLSKIIERGASGNLHTRLASEIGLGQRGFSSRVKALVYLRNRGAHHSRLWNHSVIDAGATPNNVRGRAKRLVGQFDPQSIADIVASLDDIYLRCELGKPVLNELFQEFCGVPSLWAGYTRPLSPRNHR